MDVEDIVLGIRGTSFQEAHLAAVVLEEWKPFESKRSINQSTDIIVD
jgi:hypothetical protein